MSNIGLIRVIEQMTVDLDQPARRRLPSRVKRVGLSMRRPLPVFPNEQTSAAPVGMSQSCQYATFDNLFDHLVGAGE
jgi:hypothetical protein